MKNEVAKIFIIIAGSYAGSYAGGCGSLRFMFRWRKDKKRCGSATKLPSQRDSVPVGEIGFFHRLRLNVKKGVHPHPRFLGMGLKEKIDG